MTNNVESMKLQDINQGVALASKLLSKLSPSLRSPVLPRRSKSLLRSPFKSNSESTLAFSTSPEATATDNAEQGPLADSGVYDDVAEKHDGMTIESNADENNKSFHLMHDCIDGSKHFFAEFVTNRILPFVEKAELHITDHEEIFRSSSPLIQQHDGNTAEETDLNKQCRSFIVERHKLKKGVSGLHDQSTVRALTFSVACKYLVELSCFPIWKCSFDLELRIEQGK